MPALTIQFLDVGQGDGTYVEFPGGANMLVDLGSTKNSRITGPDIFRYFHDHTRFGPTDPRDPILDLLVLTHGDRDHYNMVLSFIEQFGVRVRFFTYSGNAADYDGLIGFLIARGAVPFPVEGTPTRLSPPDMDLGDAELWILAHDSVARSDKNANSTVLQIRYGGRKVILAADATTDTETFIRGRCETAELESEVLKLGHHGSFRTSNSPEWIASVKPEYVFISADRHGASDAAKQTGHRLPQSVTIDIVKRYSTRLAANCGRHSYVAHCSANDYSEAGFGEVCVCGERNCWREISTTDGIFTTIGHMGESEAADQGYQYSLMIRHDGFIDIRSTDSLEDGAGPGQKRKRSS